MAPRPAWKGYLKLSLVTCAVELTSATTESEKIVFHILNRRTGNTVRRQYVDATTGKPVEEKNEVKGYELGGDDFLLIEEDEIDAVQIESSHTLSLDRFVSKSDIEKIYLDMPYYLTPADEVSEEAFAVIRTALEEKKMVGLTRIVLWRRERPAAIEPFGKGMLLTTLRYDKTVRQPDEIIDGFHEPKPDGKLVELAMHVIEKKQAKFDPGQFKDKHEQALTKLVRAKKSGRKAPATKEPSKPSNVINLFDALKESLSSDEAGDSTRAAASRSRKPEAGKRGSTPKAKRNSRKPASSRKRQAG